MNMLQQTAQNEARTFRDLKKEEVLMYEDMKQKGGLSKNEESRLREAQKDLDKTLAYLRFWNELSEGEHLRNILSLLDVEGSVTSMDWKTLTHLSKRADAYDRIYKRLSEEVWIEEEQKLKQAAASDEERKSKRQEFDNYTLLLRKEWDRVLERNDNPANNDPDSSVKKRINLYLRRKTELTDQQWELLLSLLTCDPRKRWLPETALQSPLFMKYMQSEQTERIGPDADLIHFEPNMVDWVLTLDWMFSITSVADQKPEVFFLATNLLRCVLSKKGHIDDDQKRRIVYVFYGAVCLELSSMYLEGDSVQKECLTSMKSLTVVQFQNGVKDALHETGGKLFVPTSWTFLASITNRPNLLKNVKEPATYAVALALVQMTPFYVELSDVEMAMLAV